MHTTRIRLARGDHLRIRDGRGALVVVGRGTAWLTQDGDRRDIVIEPGGSFRLDRDGVTMVSTDSATEIAVSAARPGGLPLIEIAGRASRAPALSL
jgi:hypothetical protein